eukprot:1160268-Pelagomonas_calceolata.AAC.13
MKVDREQHDLLLKCVTSDFDVLTVSLLLVANARNLFGITCISPGSLAVKVKSSAHHRTSYTFTYFSAHVVNVQREQKRGQRTALLDSICWIRTCPFIPIHQNIFIIL